jgi:hypothetical protein
MKELYRLNKYTCITWEDEKLVIRFQGNWDASNFDSIGTVLPLLIALGLGVGAYGMITNNTRPLETFFTCLVTVFFILLGSSETFRRYEIIIAGNQCLLISTRLGIEIPSRVLVDKHFLADKTIEVLTGDSSKTQLYPNIYIHGSPLKYDGSPLYDGPPFKYKIPVLLDEAEVDKIVETINGFIKCGDEI